MTKIITDPEYLKAIKEKEEQPVKKNGGKGRGRPKEEKAKNVKNHILMTIKEELGSGSEKDTSYDADESDTQALEGAGFPLASQCESILYFRELWKSLNPPISEEDIRGKWYAAIFLGKKEHVYIAKTVKQFLADKGASNK